jgi:hypothetical protein
MTNEEEIKFKRAGKMPAVHTDEATASGPSRPRIGREGPELQDIALRLHGRLLGNDMRTCAAISGGFCGLAVRGWRVAGVAGVGRGVEDRDDCVGCEMHDADFVVCALG